MVFLGLRLKPVYKSYLYTFIDSVKYCSMSQFNFKMIKYITKVNFQNLTLCVRDDFLFSLMKLDILGIPISV